jgi:hypothetical protein
VAPPSAGALLRDREHGPADDSRALLLRRTLSGLRQACSVLRACDVPPVRLGAKLLRAPASAPTSCASRRRSHESSGLGSRANAGHDGERLDRVHPAFASCTLVRDERALRDCPARGVGGGRRARPSPPPGGPGALAGARPRGRYQCPAADSHRFFHGDGRRRGHPALSLRRPSAPDRRGLATRRARRALRVRDLR